MLSDIEIAQQAEMKPIVEIAKGCNLTEDELELYGKYKAKVSFDAMERLQDAPNGKLVLVSHHTYTSRGRQVYHHDWIDTSFTTNWCK